MLESLSEVLARCFRTRAAAAMAAASICCLALPLSASSSASAQAACPNETLREAQGSTYLPECRAWELVSPGSTPSLESFGGRSASDGGSYAYASKNPTSDAQRSGFYYLARRGEAGWSVEEVAPQDSPETSAMVVCHQGLYYSTDLATSVLSDGWEIHEEEPTEPRCGSESSETLAAGAPLGFGNLFMRSEGGSYELINAPPAGVAPANALLQGATTNLSAVVFRERAELLPGAPAGEYDLYEWSGGVLHLVSVLPGGEPAGGAELADGPEPKGAKTTASLSTAAHAVSEDGERVFFAANGGLYVRLHALQAQSAISGGKCVEAAKACTVQVDAVQGGSGASGGGVFWYANATGSRVFFADESRLTESSFAINGRSDLYEYNVETGALTDLTPGRKVEPGDVRGFSGASEDGAYLYFVARSALTASQQNSSGAIARPEEPNLYLDHNGALTFVATLNGARDQEVWQEVAPRTNTNLLRARVAPDGLFFEFQSANQLVPSVDNAPAEEGDCGLETHACSEVYLYEAGSEHLHCVSCGSEPPTGNTEVPLTRTSTNSGRSPGYLTRTVLDSGEVFFTTPDALVTQDKDKANDVYEYREGHVWLLSGGEDPAGAEFAEASESGGEAFFITGQALVPADTNSGFNVYVARVDGGFAEQPPSSQKQCEGEECLAPTQRGLVFTAPTSVTFSGPGNEQTGAGFGEGGKQKPGHSKNTAKRSRAEKRALRRCARRHRDPRARRACERQVRRRFSSHRRGKRGYATARSGSGKGTGR